MVSLEFRKREYVVQPFEEDCIYYTTSNNRDEVLNVSFIGKAMYKQ